MLPFITCNACGIHNELLARVELTGLFFNEFSALTLAELSPSAVAALQSTGQAYSVALSLNVNNGSGKWILDNLAFR